MSNFSKPERPDRFYYSVSSDCSIWNIYRSVMDYSGKTTLSETDADRFEMLLDAWTRVVSKQYEAKSPENCAEAL